MSTSRDILHLKTNAELRFFVENPAYYQAELVAAAQRELRRRGAVVPSAAPPATEKSTTNQLVADTDPSYFADTPSRRPWLLLGSVAAVLAVASLGFWGKSHLGHSASPSAKSTGMRSQPPTAAPLKLETVVASPLPSYNTEDYVEQALKQVPAAEKANEQLVSQYRVISLRFWAAENPSAHLIKQAQQGKPNAVFGAQARLVLSLWHDFDRTQVYSYTFGPVMADHLARMKNIARYQREALGELLNDMAAQRPVQLADEQTLAHQQALPHLLAPLELHAGAATAPQ